MAYLTTFVVEGCGAFPLDMLRYDSCWPSTPEAVDGISIQPRDRDDYGRLRRVELTKMHSLAKDAQITRGRWHSFMWHVIEVRSARKF